MPAQWTSRIIAVMHMQSISKKELAHKLGYTPEWVGKVLNGKRTPEGAEARFRAALDELIQEKKEIREEENRSVYNAGV